MVTLNVVVAAIGGWHYGPVYAILKESIGAPFLSIPLAWLPLRY